MYIMDKIINILKKPHTIPTKIISRLKSFIEKLNYDEKIFIEKQNQKYAKFNLDREMGLKKLIKIKNKYKIPNRKMSSEHEVFFSSLSLNLQKNFKKILEIGTFDGNCCSNVFTKSKLPMLMYASIIIIYNSEK